MDFEEFLLACDEDKLLNEIKESYENMTPLLDVNHKKALEIYNKYLCIGGMPEAVSKFIESGKDLNNFDDNILNLLNSAYLADMTKYTEKNETIKNIAIYNSMPAQLGKENKKFKYSNINENARGRDYLISLEWLLSSRILLKSKNVKLPISPLEAYVDNDNFKIYLSDIGLLRKLSKVSINEILLNKNSIFKGAFIENAVAIDLFKKERLLYYWSLENKFEIDFLINIGGDIIPIEVKSSEHTTSKSLNYYVKKYNPKYSIRLSKKNFGFENNIKSIPLYTSFLIQE